MPGGLAGLSAPPGDDEFCFQYATRRFAVMQGVAQGAKSGLKARRERRGGGGAFNETERRAGAAIWATRVAMGACSVAARRRYRPDTYLKRKALGDKL